MWLFAFFGANCLTGTVFVWAYCVESKDKTEAEIHKDIMRA